MAGLKDLLEMPAEHPSCWEWAGACWRLKEMQQAEHFAQETGFIELCEGKPWLSAVPANTCCCCMLGPALLHPVPLSDHHKTIWFL